jgi:hypothetical protein
MQKKEIRQAKDKEQEIDKQGKTQTQGIIAETKSDNNSVGNYKQKGAK